MHTIGVDVSKKKLHVAYLVDPAREKVKSKAVSNDPAGFKTLLAWVCRHAQAEPGELQFILEATGVYHEPLAEALADAGATVCIVNPKHVHHFAVSRGIESKTDAHDGRVLALFGQERRPRAWQAPPLHARQLRALLDRLETLEEDIRRELNRREKAELQGDRRLLDSHRIVIEALEQERQRLRRDIDEHMDRHPDLRNKQRLLETVPGIGEKVSRHLTAYFSCRHFANAAQAAAFLGLVPKERQSGTSLRARPRLTKTGPSELRAKLYFPAIVACQKNAHIQALAERLQRAGKPKMAIIGAAMRKLIHLAYGVLKQQRPYEPAYA